MSHDTEEWCKVWRKTDSWFQKWHEEFVNFNASSGKSDNLHFDVLRLSKVYYVWAKKSTEELCVITLKNDAKFEEELTCALKKWREQFGAFWCSNQNFHINGLLLTKVYNAWAKTVQRIYVSLYWNQCKFWRKSDLWFHKWHEEFGEFHQSTQRSQNLCFERLFCPRYIIMSKKITEELCRDTEGWCNI